MSVFDKIGRLLTRTSLAAEILTNRQPRIRVTDRPIVKALENIYTELKLQRKL